MSPLSLALIAFACMFGAALVTMHVRSRLPEQHASRETQDTVKLGMGVVATLTAMVLGLLVGSSRSSLAMKDSTIKQFCARSIQLDRTLAQYGADTGPARQTLRRFLEAKIDQIWPREGHAPDLTVDLESVERELRQLSPSSASQKQLHQEALQIAGDLEKMRWTLVEELASPLPVPAVAILIAWTTVLFASFGLFAPRNLIAFISLLLAALSVTTALFLILELDQPLRGLIRISSAPARAALERLGR